MPLQCEALFNSPYRAKSHRNADDMGGPVNLGVNGRLLSTLVATEVEIFRPTHVVCNAAVNDIAGSASLVTLQGYLNALAPTVRGYGCKLIWETVFACGGLTAPQNTVLANWNAWLATQVGVILDGLSDPAADSRLQTVGNATYFDIDQVHLNNTGAGVHAGITFAKLLSVGGIQ